MDIPNTLSPSYFHHNHNLVGWIELRENPNFHYAISFPKKKKKATKKSSKISNLTFLELFCEFILSHFCLSLSPCPLLIPSYYFTRQGDTLLSELEWFWKKNLLLVSLIGSSESVRERRQVWTHQKINISDLPGTARICQNVIVKEMVPFPLWRIEETQEQGPCSEWVVMGSWAYYFSPGKGRIHQWFLKHRQPQQHHYWKVQRETFPPVVLPQEAWEEAKEMIT